MSKEIATNLTLDVQGLLCPLPVIRAKKCLRSLNAGEILEVLTTDPVAVIDIPHMCAQFGHSLVKVTETATGHSFSIRKSL